MIAVRRFVTGMRDAVSRRAFALLFASRFRPLHRRFRSAENDAAHDDAGACLRTRAPGNCATCTLEAVAQSYELFLASIGRCPRHVLQLIHGRSATAQGNFPGVIDDGKQQHHPVVFVTLTSTTRERHRGLPPGTRTILPPTSPPQPPRSCRRHRFQRSCASSSASENAAPRRRSATLVEYEPHRHRGEAILPVVTCIGREILRIRCFRLGRSISTGIGRMKCSIIERNTGLFRSLPLIVG